MKLVVLNTSSRRIPPDRIADAFLVAADLCNVYVPRIRGRACSGPASGTVAASAPRQVAGSAVEAAGGLGGGGLLAAGRHVAVTRVRSEVGNGQRPTMDSLDCPDLAHKSAPR